MPSTPTGSTSSGSGVSYMSISTNTNSTTSMESHIHRSVSFIDKTEDGKSKAEFLSTSTSTSTTNSFTKYQRPQSEIFEQSKNGSQSETSTPTIETKNKKRRSKLFIPLRVSRSAADLALATRKISSTITPIHEPEVERSERLVRSSTEPPVESSPSLPRSPGSPFDEVFTTNNYTNRKEALSKDKKEKANKEQVRFPFVMLVFLALETQIDNLEDMGQNNGIHMHITITRVSC